jgi:hypothetical protein
LVHAQALDEDSAAGLARLREKDAEIDAGIDAISRTIDNLTSIGSAMKDEVRTEYSIAHVLLDGSVPLRYRAYASAALVS